MAPPQMQVITVIGYRGTGKTSVGRGLAKRLNWDFVDTDYEIESAANRSIADMFKNEGEPFFRELERNEVARQLKRKNVVVSVGGGAILDDGSRHLVKTTGIVVWLQASADVIVERLRSDAATAGQRPSLTGADLFAEVETVLAARQDLYADAATIEIDTTNRSIASIVDEIICQIPKQGGES